MTDVYRSDFLTSLLRCSHTKKRTHLECIIQCCLVCSRTCTITIINFTFWSSPQKLHFHPLSASCHCPSHPQALDNHQSTCYFYRLAYCVYFISMALYCMWPFGCGFFHFASFIAGFPGPGTVTGIEQTLNKDLLSEWRQLPLKIISKFEWSLVLQCADPWLITEAGRVS